MATLSRDYAKKLRAIRLAEGLTQRQFAEMAGISLGTIKIYESGHRPARSEILEAVLEIEMFKKYTMWLIHDEIMPGVGQIAPALSLDGSGNSEGAQDSTETSQKSHR
ncbi:XRE family transcriptional regulator [Kosakonia cowanii]|nr:XRE family transcriptional regulator [Kosakonia cowanii]